MKTIKIIDLLNKIAKGEEVPERIKYNHTEYIYREITKQYYIKGCMGTYDSSLRYELTSFNRLNDEVEIVEEKKLPEKLPYYSMKKIQKAKNKDEWREERITLLEKRVNDLHIKMNDLLDFLESKEKGE